jgi:hypothetical protein
LRRVPSGRSDADRQPIKRQADAVGSPLAIAPRERRSEVAAILSSSAELRAMIRSTLTSRIGRAITTRQRAGVSTNQRWADMSRPPSIVGHKADELEKRVPDPAGADPIVFRTELYVNRERF